VSKTHNPANENSTPLDLGMLSGMLVVMALLSLSIYFLALETTELELRRECDDQGVAHACLELSERVNETEAIALRRQAAELSGGTIAAEEPAAE
jgi:hypothetical protein